VFLESFYLLAGIGLLVCGGEVLVRGAASLARSLHVSPLTTGLTVVAFGTSAPELAVNLLAAWRGSGALAFGNVMGSNLANIGLVLGCSALLRPIPVRSQIARLEIPIMLFTAGAGIVLGLDRVFGDPPDQYGRGEGLALTFLFAMFLYYTYLGARRDRANHVPDPEAEHDVGETARIRLRALVTILFGIGILWAGAHLTVVGAAGLARRFAVSEAIIGISIVAVGTSLPELAASLAAVRSNQPDLVVGNVLGSNIFNVLLVLGASAVVRPVPVPPGGAADLVMVGIFSVMLLGAAAVNRRRISRLDGVILLGAYLAYLGWRTGG
jgi:cation:H+ antiporter